MQDLKEIASSATQEWECREARCVEDGHEVATALLAEVKTHNSARILGFIDLMLPLNHSDLIEVDKLLKEREAVAFRGGDTSPRIEYREDEIESLREKLIEIDRKIAPMIEANGGVQFIERFSQSLGSMENWQFYIFTSRVDPAAENVLRENHTGLIREWLRKPINPFAIETILNGE